MSNFIPEVLIYIQTVKNFIENNSDTKKYLIGNSDEELFYEYVGKLAQENFQKNGEVLLTEGQFELIRKTLLAQKITKSIFFSDDFNNIELKSYIFLDTRKNFNIKSK